MEGDVGRSSVIQSVEVPPADASPLSSARKMSVPTGLHHSDALIRWNARGHVLAFNSAMQELGSTGEMRRQQTLLASHLNEGPQPPLDIFRVSASPHPLAWLACLAPLYSPCFRSQAELAALRALVVIGPAVTGWAANSLSRMRLLSTEIHRKINSSGSRSGEMEEVRQASLVTQELLALHQQHPNASELRRKYANFLTEYLLDAQRRWCFLRMDDALTQYEEVVQVSPKPLCVLPHCHTRLIAYTTPCQLYQVLLSELPKLVELFGTHENRPQQRWYTTALNAFGRWAAVKDQIEAI